MYIPIKYNNSLDEFSLDLTLCMRISSYINKNFNIVYEISNQAPIYLIGGAIRDLIMAHNPKDLDFVILGKKYDELITKLIKKYNISYSYNRFSGYKLNYNNIVVDMWSTDEITSSIEYNVDGLLFDLNNSSLVSLTFIDYLYNGLKIVNENNNICVDREKKLKKFDKNFRKLY